MIPFRVLNPDKAIEIVSQVHVQTPFGVEVIEQVREPAESAVVPWMTLFTCIFLHGGWMHVIGNMWFLFIFGDIVEDRLGHLGYLLFYLLCGVAASACHLMIGPESTVPTIGASGAIAGVMGAYFLFYPKAQVEAVIPIFIILQMIVLPAPIFLGIWFAFQFFQGTMSGSGSGVAWWAHIGGFVVGLACAGLVKLTTRTPPGTEQLPGHRSISHQRIYPRRRY